MKIVLHNHDRVADVIECQEPKVCNDNRIQWEGGDICAPFFLVLDEVEVKPGDPVENLAEHDKKYEWRPPDQQTFQELLKRVEALEGMNKNGNNV